VQTGHRNSAPQSFQRQPLKSGAVERARHFSADPAHQRRPERYVTWAPRPERDDERVRELRRARTALYFATGTLIATAVASAVFLYSRMASPLHSDSLSVSQTAPGGVAVDRSKTINSTIISVRTKDKSSPALRDSDETSARIDLPPISTDPTPAEMVARAWSAFGPQFNQTINSNDKSDNRKGDRLAAIAPPKAAAPAIPAVPNIAAPQVPIPQAAPRLSSVNEAKTSLINFETAPFPYHGRKPGSDKPFPSGSETFKDSRVLLHIPEGFDVKKPSVMVVFFHGHGANLSDDVRDRQEVPAQISESGVNAVLVAPQFAVNAADSSAGKFWDQDGFKRFLDESAKQFAKLNGDPKAVRAFSRMPVVIVAYSGGFGPTLAVLEHGGANSRLRGIVLLDALYAGTDKFADWISANKSSFFVSAYTPHIRRHNSELEQLLRDRSIAFGSELKPNRLPGSVTFLPTGDISHRNFVNRAWAENPIKDILLRLDVAGPTPIAADSRSGLFVARR
jgi:hypothetical protein